MKKYYALLLFAMLGILANAQTPWDGTTATWTNGSGTSTDPYLIENGQHLAYLSEQVRSGETYKDKFFKLVNDLDMGANTEHKFTPIGFYDRYMDSENQGGMIDDSKYFLGTFDGNYKKIDNIHIYYIDENPNNEVGGTGLFACISENAVIKNLGIGANSRVEGKESTGAFVGAIEGGSVENCYNEAVLEIALGALGAGGIAGSNNNGLISGCYNTGLISGHNDVGGIVGFADSKAIINNCYNTGMVTFGGFYAGGLVGYLADATMSNCYNIGNVLDDFSGSAAVGTTDRETVITNCYYGKEKSGITDTNAGVTEKEESAMKDASFIALLNGEQTPAAWVSDSQNINEGFPVLVWQSDLASGIQKMNKSLNCNIYAIGNSIIVECPEAELCQMTVMDTTGAVIAKQTFTSKNSLDIADGIYIVTVSANGQQYTAKVAVK
ncbi:T9SS type A sorting domain-containing protein [Bacteroides sp.]